MGIFECDISTDTNQQFFFFEIQITWKIVKPNWHKVYQSKCNLDVTIGY